MSEQPTGADYMHHNPGPARIALTPNKEKNMATKKKSAPKTKTKAAANKNTGPKGSKTNPHTLTNYLSAFDQELGYHEAFFVERQDTSTKTWDWCGAETTKKKAENLAKEFEKSEAEGWVNAQENKWREENRNNQQERQIVQFRVTEKTTQKELDAHLAQLVEHRDRLKANPPAVMPKFKKSDAKVAPYRIVIRTVHIEEKVAK